MYERRAIIILFSGFACFTTWYTLQPLITEGKVLKKIQRLEEAGQCDEARRLAASTEFKVYRVEIKDENKDAAQ